MQIEKKTEKDTESYCCSNPNCKHVFSQNKFLISKLREKVKELANITNKNLDLSKCIKSLETERVSNKLKIREDADRLTELENRISNKSDYIKTLDKNLSELREKIGKLTKEREDAKRIQDLELETNLLRDAKQPMKAKVQGSKDVEFEHTIDEAKDLQINKIKMQKQEKSFKAQDLPATKFTYSEQTTKKDDEEKDSTSNNGCGFYFGYLSERDKGEAISTACVECPKSIDCMLSKVHKSNDSVKEIKKWYHFR